MNEPCMCGDPDCLNCFPQHEKEEDEDEVYGRVRQQEIDAARELVVECSHLIQGAE